MKIAKSVDVKKMKREIKQLEGQGLKKGVDFDIIVRKEGETDEEMKDKLLANRFMIEDLKEIGSTKKNPEKIKKK